VKDRSGYAILCFVRPGQVRFIQVRLGNFMLGQVREDLPRFVQVR